jgi:hypothetical protein
VDVLFQQEVEPVVDGVEGVDEYVSKRVKAGFAILDEFIPRQLCKCVKIPVSHLLVVF